MNIWEFSFSFSQFKSLCALISSTAKKSGRKLSDVEEEDEEDEDGKEILGLEEEEEEGEKENEDLCNDGEIPVSDAKTKRGKRKNRQVALDEEPNDKRTKRVSTEQGTGTVSGFVVTKHVGMW